MSKQADHAQPVSGKTMYIQLPTIIFYGYTTSWSGVFGEQALSTVPCSKGERCLTLCALPCVYLVLAQ